MPLTQIRIAGAGLDSVNGDYHVTPASEIPRGFDKVCKEQGWDTQQMWRQLGGGKPWFKAQNEAYIYWNAGDGMWWIDAPDGNGVYKARAPDHAPPQIGWELLGNYAPAPAMVRSLRAGHSEL